MSDLISPNKIEEVFGRLPDGVLRHLTHAYNYSDDTQTREVYVGEWSRSFVVSQRDIQHEFDRTEVGTNYYIFVVSRIADEIDRILLSLIPDFVESIDDSETWLVMSDYWEERDDDRAIACRTVAENLQSIHTKVGED